MMYSALLMICLIILSYLLMKKQKKTPCKVYLKDFACYKPPPSQKCSRDLTVKLAIEMESFSPEMLDFMKSNLHRCGIGDSTYLAEIFFKKGYKPSMEDARREVQMAVFGSVDMVLAKTGVKVEKIGILIVNCCIYNTQPSVCSMIVNHYKLRESVICYNLGGMGCSAGLVAIGLAKHLLQVHHNSYALIVSTESITENCYVGNDRSKFIINCLFRVGGAAILLSNHPSDHKTSKYELLHAVRTNTSSSDRCYNSIVREEDAAGIVGVTISKHLLAAAVATIEPNITAVSYLILPIREKIRYVMNCIGRKLLHPAVKIRPYVPNYSDAVDHFLPHVGGKVVLDELQKSLGFSDGAMEASRMTLHRYGNTSSSSIWYELAYVEAKDWVMVGNRVWQMAFGSGFKCQSVIWRAMKTVGRDECNPWTDEIDGFPAILVDKEINLEYIEFEPSRLN